MPADLTSTASPASRTECTSGATAPPLPLIHTLSSGSAANATDAASRHLTDRHIHGIRPPAAGSENYLDLALASERARHGDVELVESGEGALRAREKHRGFHTADCRRRCLCVTEAAAVQDQVGLR